MSFPLPVAFHSDGRGGHGAVALRYLDTRLPVYQPTCIHLELQIGSTLDCENEAMDWGMKDRAHETDATGDHDAMPGILRRMELMEGALDKMET